MGLEIPDLDDRTFEELVTDARKRIPVHSENWTDHNLSDPGITMLEVLTWVAESDIYELDRVTDRHVRKYLRLLGVEPNPPRAATAMLSVEPTAATAGQIRPAGTTLTATDAGEDRRFATESSVALTGASVAAVVSDTAGGRIDQTTANKRTGLHYHPFGERAGEGATMYVGFDGDPFDAGRLDLFVDYHDADLPDPASHGDEGPSFEPSARVEWSYFTGGAVYDPDDWTALHPDADGTDQFYGSGTLRFPEPTGWSGVAPQELFDSDEPLYWLRARVAVSGHEIPPRVNGIETGVIEAVHRVRDEDEHLSRIEEGSSAEAARRSDQVTTTTARPDQAFAFGHAPVLDATVIVGGKRWDQVVDFDASGPNDTDYVLDHERGAVRFGDGVRGEVPAPDQAVRATWYDHGGGTVGNVGAGAEWVFDDSALGGVTVASRGPVTGGRGAESTDAALARLKGDLRTPYRAVTEADVRYLATHTPGLRFGRAAVHVEGREAKGGCARHTLVRVAVVPESTRDPPRASEGFLEAVQCHLERYRLLTDELCVETPPYVPVDVGADVEVAQGYAVDRRIEAVESELEQFLDPLEGFNGEGWPFGRPVYRSEVYEAIEGVGGIECVTDVELRAGPPGTDEPTGIGVPGTALVYLDDATVTADDRGDRCGEWSQ